MNTKLKLISNNIIEIINKYKYIIIIILCVLFFHIRYLIISTRNIPIMDYWKFIDIFGEKIMSGNFYLKDLWTNFSGHRNPLTLSLFYINLRFFDFNTLFGVFTGVLFNIVTLLCLLKAFFKENILNLYQTKKIQFLSITFIFAVFSLNQWEIITLDFSISFMIRIFCYIGYFILLNFSLINSKNKYYLCFLLIFIICIVSQAYFVSFVGSILFVVFLHFCLKYKEDKFLNLKYYIFLYLSAIIGTLLYIYGSTKYLPVNESYVSIFTFLLNFFKGTLLMFGSSLIQYFSVYPFLNINNNTIIMFILGTIVLLLYFYALFIYFHKKMYKKTYIPLFLILYCFFSIFIIYYSRSYSFDLHYLSSSRYTCETLFGIIGILWIFSNYILDSNKINISNKNIKLFSVYLSIFFIITCLIFSIYKENKIGPYRGANFDLAREIVINIDNVPDEELVIFQANNPMLVRNGVVFLKKYNLSLFSKNIINNNIDIKYEGFYDIEADGGRWISGNASIFIENSKSNNFILYGYYPINMHENSLILTINNNESIITKMVPGDTFRIETIFQNNYNFVLINLKTEKVFIPKDEGWNNDMRELGVYIISWSLSEID